MLIILCGVSRSNFCSWQCKKCCFIGALLLMQALFFVPRLYGQETPSADTVPVLTAPLTADSIPVNGAAPVVDTVNDAALPTPASGQADGQADKTKLSSAKALLFSAIIPGGGQFYNRKYWKIPIVYGGFIALGVSIDFNQGYYNEFVRELNYRGDGDPLTVPKYDEESIPSSRIIEARNYYRRYRDLCIIGVGIMYGLNIVDAYVDAELSNFDISEDLSMKLHPSLQFDPSFASSGMGVAPGFSLTFAVQ